MAEEVYPRKRMEECSALDDRGTQMTDTTAHVALAGAMQWLQEVQATIRFFDDEDGPKVRVAVRHSRDPDHFAFALVPVTDSTPESLAASLSAAREQIEPQMRRSELRLV